MIVRSVKDMGALVRDQRKKLGWSQAELAAQIGVQRLWVSQFEAGKTTAHFGLVMRTLRALDLELQIDKRLPPEARGGSKNLSYFAFTATPKAKTRAAARRG